MGSYFFVQTNRDFVCFCQDFLDKRGGCVDMGCVFILVYIIHGINIYADILDNVMNKMKMN